MTGNATACARVIIEELISRGVRDVVLAPGARNAPLAYECFEADRIGLLRLHVRVDERTAGFLGLGLAKGYGAPVAVLTTSGHRVGQPASGGARGLARTRAADRDHCKPTAISDQCRGQPEH